MSLRSEIIRILNEVLSNNKKITELPSATTPLAGTELFEIVQGGVNKKVAKSDVSTGGGGSSTFVSLTDGPGAFTGKTLNFVRVNAGETALEYQTPSDVLSAISAQPLDADLTAIAALGFASTSFLKKTAANTWALDTNIYATQAYADSLVVGLLDDRGNFDASGNLFPASGGSGTAGAILKGDLWTISVAGTLGGHTVTAGDVVRALSDTPGQTDSNWAISENNFGYVALNQAIADGKFYVGNGSGIGTAVTPTGDVTFTNAGVFSIGSLKVTNAMIANTTIDLTAKVTGMLPSANGGIANGFTKFTGPTTSEKTFTLPNASATILTDNALVTLAQGGTNANLTASNGGIFYSTASAAAILSGTATANKVLMSGASGAPSWSTPTFPNASATLNTSIISDGTNWIASTVTRPNSATTGDLLYASGTNVYANLADVATGNALISGGVATAPSWGKITSAHVDSTILSNPMTSVGDMIQGTTSGTPVRLASVAVGSVLLSGGVTTANAWGAVSNGLTATASTLKWGGAITAATSITGAFALDFTQAINSAFTVSGTWIASATNQFHQNFTGTLTARGTASDNLLYSVINPTLIAAANGQYLICQDINPTFTNGAFTTLKNLGLRQQTGSMLIGSATSAVSRDTYRVEIYGFGTSTTSAALAVFNSSSQLLIAAQDDGQLLLGNAASSSAPRIATQNNTVKNIAGQGIEFACHFSNSATNRSGFHFTSTNASSENATTTTGFMVCDPSYSPSAGAMNFELLKLSPTLNQTGTASGYFAGIKYDPATNVMIGANYFIISSTGLNGFGTLTPTYQLQVKGTSANQNLFVVQEDGGTNALEIKEAAGVKQIGFFAATPAAQQTSGANLTNNVTSGGTDDTISNYTDLTIYANDAAAIRNDIYQLARKLKQVNDGLRTLGLLT